MLQTQTVMINGTQYQIVTPVNLVSGSAATPASAPPAVTTVHYSAAGQLSGGHCRTMWQQLFSRVSKL